MNPVFVPFNPDQAPRLAIESALADLPPETCPHHPGEILKLDRDRSLYDFGYSNKLMFTADRDADERGRCNLTIQMRGVKPPPHATRPAHLDVSPAGLLAEWAATLPADRAPLAALASLRSEWPFPRPTGAEFWVLRAEFMACPACWLARCGVPPILQRAAFERFDTRGGVLAGHLAKCREFAASPRGFLRFTGPVGNGKDFLAVAICRAVLGRMTPFFLSHERLMVLHRARYGRGDDCENETTAPALPVIEACQEADLLVLADLSRNQHGRDEEGVLHAIISHRYDHYLPTIVSVNVPDKELPSLVGSAVYDRLEEGKFAKLEFALPSLRPAINSAYLAAPPPPPARGRPYFK
jgi:DNA replication protein DnaC